MARLDQEEQEKLDSLKAWWNRYGTIITIALAVAVATIGGGKVWDHFQRQQAEQAADLYALLKQVQAGGDLMKITDAAHLLTEGYTSSGYAPRAAMIVVKASMDASDLKRAKEHLQWILDNAKEPEMIDLARLRLAGILLDEKNYSAALQQLNTKHGGSFNGLYADLKGDVLLASGKIEEARLSYEVAVDALSQQNNYYNIVQMKADALSEPYMANKLLELDNIQHDDADGMPEESIASGDSEEARERVELSGGDEPVDSDENTQANETVLPEDSEALIDSDEFVESVDVNVVDETDVAIDSVEGADDRETVEEFSEDDETSVETDATESGDADDEDSDEEELE